MPKYNRRLYGRPKEKGVKVELPKPRDLEEIQKEYSQLCAQAGQTQYQIGIFSKQLEQLNNNIQRLNEEADARQKLNKEKAEKEAQVTQGESNV